jgi:hypothetical protein
MPERRDSEIAILSYRGREREIAIWKEREREEGGSQTKQLVYIIEELPYRENDPGRPGGFCARKWRHLNVAETKQKQTLHAAEFTDMPRAWKRSVLEGYTIE